MPEISLFPGQMSIYLQCQNPAAQDGLYIEQISWLLKGSIETELFKESLTALSAQHTCLRTSFKLNADGKLVQLVHEQALMSFRHSAVNSITPEEILLQKDIDMSSSWHLDSAPLLRWTLIHDLDSNCLLICSYHHIILDGWSFDIILHDLMNIYNSKNTLPYSLNSNTVDIIQNKIQSKVISSRAYWNKNARLPKHSDLANYKKVPKLDKSCGYSRHYSSHGSDLTKDLLSTSQKMKVTLPSIVQALWIMAQDMPSSIDAYYAVGVALQPVLGVVKAVGMFVNTVPLSISPLDRSSFESLAVTIHRLTMDAFEHSTLPFEDIYQLHNQNLPHASLTSLVVFEGADFNSAVAQLNGVTSSTILPRLSKTSFPLCLSVHSGDNFSYSIVSKNDIVDLAEADKIAQRFDGLLKNILSISTSPDNQQRISPLKKEDTMSASPNVLLHEQFFRIADARPDAPAVSSGNENLTYRQLAVRATQISNFLIDLRLPVESVIALVGPRSPDSLACFLGILRAGLTCLPLDNSQPEPYTDKIILQAKPALFLASGTLTRPFPEITIYAQEIYKTARSTPSASPPVIVNHNLSYLIFTSGTTGSPKGIAIEHFSAVQFIDWALTYYSEAQLSSVIWCTSISFDLSIFEIFATLSSGGVINVVENALLIKKSSQPSLLNTVPSVAIELLAHDAIPTTVSVINLAGEPLPKSLAENLLALPHIKCVNNLYGPSEDTTYSTLYPMDKEVATHMHIGRSLPTKHAIVLDEHLNIVPLGHAGELFLYGSGLARGYYLAPKLTAINFLPNPYSNVAGSRMYRTGDLAKFKEDGTLVYLGRVDNQVKIRGYRIELEGVERLIIDHPDVADAGVALLHPKDGHAYLCAAVVFKGATLEEAALTAWLKKRMLAAAVPKYIHSVNELPRTHNGKLDRKALKDCLSQLSPTFDSLVNTRNATDTVISETWIVSLASTGFNIDDNFFDAGGDSLLLFRTWSNLQQHYPSLSLVDVYQYPTIRLLSDFIEGVSNQASSSLAGPTRESAHGSLLLKRRARSKG